MILLLMWYILVLLGLHHMVQTIERPTGKTQSQTDQPEERHQWSNGRPLRWKLKDISAMGTHSMHGKVFSTSQTTKAAKTQRPVALTHTGALCPEKSRDSAYRGTWSMCPSPHLSTLHRPTWNTQWHLWGCHLWNSAVHSMGLLPAEWWPNDSTWVSVSTHADVSKSVWQSNRRLSGWGPITLQPWHWCTARLCVL